MKRWLVISLICFSIIILSLSFVSASWFGDFWNKITGHVVSSTQCSDGTNLGQIQMGTGSARWMCTDYTGNRENLDCYGGDNNPYLDIESHGWTCGRWGWECEGVGYNSGYCCDGVHQNEACVEPKEISFVLEEGKIVTKTINEVVHSFKIISLSNYFPPTVVLEVNGRRLFPLSEGYIYTTDSKLNIFVKDINKAQISGQVNEVELIVSNEPMCFDSDNGKDYSQTGNVAINFSFGTGIISMDFCKDANVLQEGFCLNEKSRFENYNCTENKICKNGACIERSCGDGECNGDETCSTCSKDCGICVFCNDSDVTDEFPDGKNYYLRGEVNSLDDWGKVDFASDNCLSSVHIGEYFCQRNDIVSKFYACPYGCVDGACIAEREVSCDYAIENDFEKTSFTCENNKITSYYEKENLFAKDCVEECSNEEFCVEGITHCIKKEQDEFFPIGIYVYGDTLDFELNDIANLNFNTIIAGPAVEPTQVSGKDKKQNYIDEYQKLLTDAEQRNLKVILIGTYSSYASVGYKFDENEKKFITSYEELSQDNNIIEKAVIDDINYFYNYPAFYKLYLSDEPGIHGEIGKIDMREWDMLQKTMNKMNSLSVDKLGLSVFVDYASGDRRWSWEGPIKSYDDIFNLVNPSVMMIDSYPFNTYNTNPIKLNEDIDKSTIAALKELRETSLKYDIPFWFTGQVFSEPSAEGAWREPTPAEINLWVNLALVYGAKGIFYFDYATNNKNHISLLNSGRGYFADKLAKGNNFSMEELEAYKVQPKYDAVQQLNDELEVLGPLLLNLKSTGAWNSQKGISSSTIQSVSGNFEIGTFEDEERENYIMLVNRDTENFQIAEIKLNPDYVELEDMYSKERFQEDKNLEKPFKLFEINFEPGEGKLLRLDKNITFFGRFVNVLKRAFNLE